ncbi:MAG: ABC transporter permease/substrate-binding protein [Tepidibacillus sp.]
MSTLNRLFELIRLRQDVLIQTTYEHLQISLISILIAIFIAIPLGIYLTRYPKIAEPIISITAVLQTIPSLALLGFMIPLLGIGKLPAIIALSAYALLPILRNTYTGIKEVDSSLIEAATGMGMNSFRRLTKVELPLAMPVIMAGLRTAMTLVVGTAMLAALIGAGGLGDLILLGIQRADNGYILLGAIPAGLLALFFDYILRFTEKRSKGATFTPMITVLVIALIVVLIPSISTSSQKDIVIGSKLGAEPEILINMYKLLIEDQTDLNVQLQPGLGGTDFVFSALKKGDIDLYPEFTGTVITSLLKQDPVSTNETEVYDQARVGLAEQQLVLLKPMAYNNTYALAVKEETAKRFQLNKISDLKKVANQITAGFTFEFKDREDGYQGIKKKYGLVLPHIKTMDAGLRAKALVAGDVDLIDAYSTDGYMIKYQLKVLQDDKHLFPPYQGAPLIREDTLNQHPELKDILNQLAWKISEKEMQEMNYRVDYEDESPGDVAKEYLEKEGLLK